MNLHKLKNELEIYYKPDSRITNIAIRKHIADQQYKDFIIVYYEFNGNGRNVFIDQRVCCEAKLTDYVISQINGNIVNHDGRLYGYQLLNFTN